MTLAKLDLQPKNEGFMCHNNPYFSIDIGKRQVYNFANSSPRESIAFPHKSNEKPRSWASWQVPAEI